METHVKSAKKCLKILGQAYKGDFSQVDGRIIQSQLDNIIDVLNGDWSVDTFCNAWGINPKERCWTKYTSMPGGWPRSSNPLKSETSSPKRIG